MSFLLGLAAFAVLTLMGCAACEAAPESAQERREGTLARTRIRHYGAHVSLDRIGEARHSAQAFAVCILAGFCESGCGSLPPGKARFGSKLPAP